MSDDIFDWGKGNGNHLHISPVTIQANGRPKKKPLSEEQRKAREAQIATVVARQTARTQKVKAEWEELQKTLENEQQSDPDKYTHVWYGELKGTPIQTFKELTGQKLEQQNVLLPRQHDFFRSRGHRFTAVDGKMITQSSAREIVIFRLTKTQATMAKLKRWNKEFQVDDADGAIWKSLFDLIHASRLDQDNDETRKGWTDLLKAIAKLL